MIRSRQPASLEYTEEEAAQRRDEVIRRMANTPPQPKLTLRPKKKKTTARDRVAAQKAVPARKKS